MIKAILVIFSKPEDDWSIDIGDYTIRVGQASDSELYVTPLQVGILVILVADEVAYLDPAVSVCIIVMWIEK
jgi:hypothetical protein